MAIVGKALARARRDSVVLATKVHAKMHDEDPNQFGICRAAGSFDEVEGSLAVDLMVEFCHPFPGASRPCACG